MMISQDHRRQLLVRLRLVSIIVMIFGCVFFSYSFFSEEFSSLSPLPNYMDDVESSGLELSTLEGEGFFPVPTRQIFLIGSFLFLTIGLMTFFIATRQIKKLG
jgi:hypothetical protein